MKDFAAIDANNIVTRIAVAGDDDAQPGCGLKPNEVAWIECKKGGSIRANFPIVGGEYRPVEDVFCGEKLFPSWTLNTSHWRYEAPVREPGAEEVFFDLDGVNTQFTGIVWDEENQRWLGTIASSVEGQAETHLDQYLWNPADSSWTFDSTIEKPTP